MSDLPAERVLSPTPPFMNTWTDYFGPLFVKFSRKARSKIYIYVLVLQALHIKLAGDLSAEIFILTFCKFIARRDNPQATISNNGAKCYLLL